MAEKKDRCWPGYEPVPGKQEHEQGSCRPKAESKATPSEKQFRAKRRKQLDKWEAEHPNTRKSASQHLHAPGTEPKTQKKSAKKKSPAKTTAKKRSPKKTAASKRGSASKTPSSGGTARKRASR